ncbi:MAG: hypothetical protein KJ620_05085 [Candidatus Edwardsbacteria bacterium]|nr:hypothetical protein [Candidatus Edwardsbacteria bacterium]MBU1577112.1 hypothetical protein [Candidatus Edwardsbacteria bacterium]MBU2463551.1 hypothetical protein [Candidatus Edwardsbacteria bacterium]MBU2594044.1 hypothetical protein [Candidatus Edwardsbacteria bacterium]
MLKNTDLPDMIHSQSLSRENLLLLLLAVDVSTPKSVKTLIALGKTAGCTEIYKWNVSEILKRTRGMAIRLPEGWSLTSKGRNFIRSSGILHHGKSVKVVNNAQQLRAHLTRIKNTDTKAFLDETINAYEGALYRSSVVLSWTGAMSLLYDQVMSTCLSAFNIEASKRYTKWKNAKIKDDLARMGEADFLDIIGSPPISIISKNLKEELKNNCLKLRNACGHPSSLKIGENRTSAHLEVLILNIFTKFV